MIFRAASNQQALNQSAESTETTMAIRGDNHYQGLAAQFMYKYVLFTWANIQIQLDGAQHWTTLMLKKEFNA